MPLALPRFGPFSRKELVIVVAIGLSLTVLLQFNLGIENIYVRHHEERLSLHNAIVTNTLPVGVNSWTELGANSVQRRYFAVWTAQQLINAGLPFLLAHFLQDSAFLFATFVALAFYLRMFVDFRSTLLGLLVAGTFAVLTYRHWYFHPWDRMSQFLWVLGFISVARGSLLKTLLVVVVGVLVKPDIVLLPILWLLVWYGSLGKFQWRRILGGIALAVASYIVMIFMSRVFPAEETPLLSSRMLSAAIRTNLKDILDLGVVGWPPLLFWGWPATMVALAWKHLAQSHRRLAMWGILCIAASATPDGGMKELRNQFAFFLGILPVFMLALAHVLRGLEKQNLDLPGHATTSDCNPEQGSGLRT